MIRNPYKRKRSPPTEDSPAVLPEDPQQEEHAVVRKTESRLGKESPVSSSSSVSTTTRTSAAAAALVIAASDKAGMEGIDRAKIDAIILRESANSLYIQQQQRRDQKVNQRIEKLRDKLLSQKESAAITATTSWKQQLQDEIDRELIPSILKERPNRSTAVVVDMDMFYMACELLTRPDLVDKPACVGKEMILTSNYTARKYGVRSAMAGWIGDKLVQELSHGKETLIHVPSHFDLYQEKSIVVRQVLAEYDPHLRAYSLDEAYMDLGPYMVLKLTKPNLTHSEISTKLKDQQIEKELSSTTRKSSTVEDGAWKDESLDVLNQFSHRQCEETVAAIMYEMRQKVKDQTGGLTCSAGVASNFLLAKIASDKNKPNGQCVVPAHHDAIVHFLYPMSIRKVSGIGRVTEKILQAFDIHTVEQMYQERALVRFLFHKSSTADFLLRASLGCSSSDKSDESGSGSSNISGQKGISRERTFQPGKSWGEINGRLEDIGRLLSSDMQRKNIRAQTLTVKVKLHTFDCLSKSRTVSQSLQEGGPLVDLAAVLLKEIRSEFEGPTFSVRLLGIRCSNFVHQDEGQSSIKAFLTRSPTASSSAVGSKPKSTPVGGPPILRKKEGVVLRNRQLKLDELLYTGEHENEVENESGSCRVECPVCQHVFPWHIPLISIHRHVDQCLGFVSDTPKSQQQQSQSRKRSISDYFHKVADSD